MAKIFSVDLKGFTLHRPIGKGPEHLERTLDVTDLTSVLFDEGFSNFDNAPTYHRMHGIDLNSLREQVASYAIGIPRSATVEIKRLANIRDKVLVTFRY